MTIRFSLFEQIPKKEIKPMACRMATYATGEEMALYFVIREFEYRHPSRTWDQRVAMAHGIRAYFMLDDALLRPNIESGFNQLYFDQQLRMLSQYVSDRERLTPSQAEQIAASLFDPFWACVAGGGGNSSLQAYLPLMSNPKDNTKPRPLSKVGTGSFSDAAMQRGLGELILKHAFPDNIWNKN